MFTVFTKPCIVCHKQTRIQLDEYEHKLYVKWKNGEIPYIQDAFPDWSIGKRELLVSGIHPACFDELFPSE